jgi:CRP-like cAMP-binding protein
VINKPTEIQLNALLKAANALVKLDDMQSRDFTSIWYSFSAKRKEILSWEGQVEKYLYFVLSGVQRVYYYDESGREATIVFTYEPSFGGVLDSFLMQNKSKYFYETLSPSDFLRVSYHDLQKLIDKHPFFREFITKGISYSFAGIIERLVELQCFSSEDKFKSLLKRSPHILHLVPHKYLANYLGIDATNFSKLINKVAI